MATHYLLACYCLPTSTSLLATSSALLEFACLICSFQGAVYRLKASSLPITCWLSSYIPLKAQWVRTSWLVLVLNPPAGLYREFVYPLQ
jgi:hypothetical protein